MKPSLITAFTFLLFFAACDAPKMPLPGVTGRANELVVVIKDPIWEGHLGDTVFSALTASVYGLPQPEPMFDVVQIRPSAFSSIFKTHRNVIVFNINDTLEPRLKMRKNVWAKPQTVIEVSGPDEKTIEELFLKRSDKVIDHYLAAEEERTLVSYRAQKNEEAITTLKTDLGVTLDIPKGYSIVRKEEDVQWIRYQTKDVTQSILVYTEPYARDSTFSPHMMAAVMNMFTERVVPGPNKGSFMKINTVYPVQYTETELADRYASELRGLWDLEGGIMGGSFVCRALLDERFNRVIYVHTFLFAPGKDKRNYMRQLEAILASTRLS
jgi:hypothetical protein